MTASVETVAATLGRPITDEAEKAQVSTWINSVLLLIRKRLGPIAVLDQDVVEYVVSETVARRVRNPEGKLNERIDDYSYGLSSEAAKAGLYILDDEWALLTADDEGASGAVHAVVRPHLVASPDWWSPWR